MSRAPISLSVEGLSKLYRKTGKSSGVTLPRFLRRSSGANHARELWALDDVSFELRRGDVLGVIGSNGAGKSTLLKILGRVTPPTRGRAIVHGRVVPLLELGKAFQPDATGRENAFLNAALYGIPRSVVQQRLVDIVQFAELDDFIDEPVRQYSSGMYARLAFSVAVNMDPDVLLADEILAVGDMVFQQRCLDRIREAGSLGTTVLFVSHDMAMVRQMCTRAIWLSEGRIAAEGNPADVISAYEGAARARTAAARLPVVAEGPDKERRPSSKQLAAEAAASYGELVSVKLLSATGREVTNVSLNEEASISVTFKTFRSDVNVRCALAVLTDSGSPAFRSPQPAPVHLAGAGTYSAIARIPANLLNDVTYTLKVAVAIEGRDFQATLVKTHALSFQAVEEDGISATRGTYPDELPGALRPLLIWTLEQCEEPVQES